MSPLFHLSSCTSTNLIYILLIPWLLLSVNLIYQAPYFPCTKSHVPFKLLISYQIISVSLSLCVWTFHTKIWFYIEELLAPYPTPKLEDIHVSAARHNCFVNIFVTTFHIGDLTFIHILRTRNAVTSGACLSWHFVKKYYYIHII